MSINKVVFGEQTLIDLSSDTVNANRMYKGDTAHAADGSQITGTAEIIIDGTNLIMPPGLCTLGTVDPETHHWVRPDYFPDIASVYNGETNTIYMVVDATGRISDPHVSIQYVTLGSSYTVQVGSIQNGIFTVTETEIKENNAVYTKVFTPANSYYPVIKISADHLRTFQLQAWTSDADRNYAAQYQPIIMWIGHMEYSDNLTRTPYFTEYEKINVDSCNATFMQNRWNSAYFLQEVDISDWDTSTWALTNLSGTWYLCRCLEVITGVENLDTSNWVITSMNRTFNQCFKLKSLDLSEWDTSKWKVNTLDYTWDYCLSLQELNVSTWNTSGWTVTKISHTFNQCAELKALDVRNWNTSNWAVTSMVNTWDSCYDLVSLDLSTWDTSGWAVTSLASTWNACRSLQTLDVSTWDTSGWVVTTLATTWQNCNKLVDLNLNRWDVSNWPVTTLVNTWSYCYDLEYLHVSAWDTSDWEVTNINMTFHSCKNLTVIEALSWNTSNWTITAAQQTFNWCNHVLELDLSNWDTSRWTLTATNPMGYTYRYCLALRTLNLSSIDISKIHDFCTPGNASFVEADYILQNIIFGENNSGKLVTSTTYPVIRFDYSPLLTHESLLNIIDALASGVSGKTLQLGSINLNKLTTAEKAIATGKGWTLT